MLTWHTLLLLSLLQRKGQGSFFPNPICRYNDIARISADVAVVLIPTIFYPIINPVCIARPPLRANAAMRDEDVPFRVNGRGPTELAREALQRKGFVRAAVLLCPPRLCARASSDFSFHIHTPYGPIPPRRYQLLGNLP